MRKKKEEPIRIAHIVGKWVGGGVEAVIMNYYRHIDRSKIQFDFICDDDSTNIPYDEIEKLGGRVILVPPYQKVFKYHKELKRVLKEGNYKIVHSHINTLSVFSLFAAKCAGVPVRIAHSHSTINNNKKELKRNILKNILKHFSKIYSTDYFACSENAAKCQFGDNILNDEKFFLINNAVCINDFKLNKKIRNQRRKELGISDKTIVIGHIGRFVDTKNHKFIIDVFNELHKKNTDSILLLAGQGPLENEIKLKVNELGLSDSVFFLGQRTDVNELYQVFDIFLLPSLYEGLGMVLIEGQVSGLPCIASKEVPSIVKINDNFRFIGLDEDVSVWREAVQELFSLERNDCSKQVASSGYDINKEVKKLEKKYSEMWCAKDD